MSGPGGFRLSFPIPRLPRILGSASKLSAASTIYPAMVQLDVPISVVAFSVATGALASNYSISTGSIAAFATRFASLFREYCIVGCRFEVRISVTANASGILAVWIDEDSNATPTAAQAANRARLDVGLVANPVDRVYRIDWKPLDYLDLDWTDGGTNTTPAFLKLYTDVANFGTTATTTAQVLVTGTVALCFRGYV